MLNADKIEFLITGTQRQREQIKNVFPGPFYNRHVMPAISTRDLVIMCDDKFNFRKHISHICRTCYYHIRDLRRIRR